MKPPDVRTGFDATRRAVATVYETWAGLDRGWRASLVGGLVVAAAALL